jgi:hypothetical protein
MHQPYRDWRSRTGRLESPGGEDSTKRTRAAGCILEGQDIGIHCANFGARDAFAPVDCDREGRGNRHVARPGHLLRGAEPAQRGFSGVFYVGVRTTGVFCRPTCLARPPKRENCESFADARQAMLAFYRRCKRCRPLSHPNETSAIVRRLVHAIEREPDRLWRAADFDALHVHASTARRQFRKRFGITFVEYYERAGSAQHSRPFAPASA